MAIPTPQEPLTADVLLAVERIRSRRYAEAEEKIYADVQALLAGGDQSSIAPPKKRGPGRPKKGANDAKGPMSLYNLFVSMAQLAARGTEVKNQRAYMSSIGTHWRTMDQVSKDAFKTTYKELFDSLNDKRKENVEHDFAVELKLFEAKNRIPPFKELQARSLVVTARHGIRARS